MKPEKEELKAPLIVSGDLDGLKVLKCAVQIEYSKSEGRKDLHPDYVPILERWLNSIDQAINDEEFEQTQP